MAINALLRDRNVQNEATRYYTFIKFYSVIYIMAYSKKESELSNLKK